MRTIQQNKMFFKRENVHCRVCKSFRVRFQVCFSIFQAHRDEVITMVANPVVDQVISAGLGESKLFVFLSKTSKKLIIKKYKIYLLRAQYSVHCKLRAHLPFVCVKIVINYFHCSSLQVFANLSVLDMLRNDLVFSPVFTWLENIVARNKKQTKPTVSRA